MAEITNTLFALDPWFVQCKREEKRCAAARRHLNRALELFDDDRVCRISPDHEILMEGIRHVQTALSILDARTKKGRKF